MTEIVRGWGRSHEDTSTESRLRMLLEQLPACLWTTDTELRITSSVGAGLAALGLKPNQLNGASLYEYLRTDDPDDPIILPHKRAVGGESLSYESEWMGRCFQVHLEPLRDARSAITGSIGLAFDITERKRLEEQLRQAQKLEAVGRLAGGVAHDFNNLLTAIVGYSDLIMLDCPDSALSTHAHAQEIKRAAERAASLTRQLLAYGRQQVLSARVVNLNSIISDMERMLRRLLGKDVELVTRLGSEVRCVTADPGQIEQVLLNLVLNARDAMPAGGELTIETANVELDKSFAWAHVDVQPGAYVRLSVADTGCGMTEAVRARVFEPFFTTKEVGKGTGLGLATVYGILKQSGGHIEVLSAPGHGSVFQVFLPDALVHELPDR